MYTCTDKDVIIIFSVTMREDRYFIAGRAITVSLVHGAPPADFLSPTFFSCLVSGPELAKPLLEDVADSDLHVKIKRVIFSVFTLVSDVAGKIFNHSSLK